jgi:hypothetical protein
MATLTLETLVGYLAAQDVYVSFSEYYGDGTIYGCTEILTPDGNPVKGAGKYKTDLVNENVVLGSNLGSVTGDLVVVGVAPEVVAEVAPEVVAEVAPEVVAEVAPEVVAEVAPEVVAEVAPEVAPEVAQVPDENRYTVSFSVLGFDITREFIAKIDVEGRKIYLS